MKRLRIIGASFVILTGMVKCSGEANIAVAETSEQDMEKKCREWITRLDEIMRKHEAMVRKVEQIKFRDEQRARRMLERIDAQAKRIAAQNNQE